MLYRNKLILAATVAVLTMGSAVAAPLVVTPDNLKEILVQSNDQLRIQAENKKIADYRLKSAEAIYSPSLTFDSTYSNANQSISGQQLGVSKTFSNKFTYNQILFANDKVKNSVKLALLSTYGSSIQYDSTYNDVLFQTYSAYYQAAKAKEMVLISQKAVDQTQARLNITKKQLYGAVGDKASVLIGNIRVQLMTQQQALMRAKQNEILARKNLALLLKKDADEIEVATQISDGITKPDTSGSYETAKQNRVEYKQIGLANDVAYANKAVADAAYSLLPTLSLTGTYDIKNTTSPSFFNPAAGDKTSSTQDWMVAVAAQWVIMDGARNSNESLAQVAIAKQNEMNKQALDDRIKVEIDSAVFTLNTAYEQIEIARESMGVAKDNLAVAQKLYNNGVGTEADLKDAETGYTQASTNYINAYYDYKLAVVGLNKALGQL